jgi:hypothetical protein
MLMRRARAISRRSTDAGPETFWSRTWQAAATYSRRDHLFQ